MAGVNKVILVGRLGRDPEVRYTSSSIAVASFSIATSQQWRDKETGEITQKTEWHRVVAWRRLAELCGEYLSKGSQVYIEGRLETRSWEQDGTTRYITEIVTTNIQFLGTKNFINKTDNSKKDIVEFREEDQYNSQQQQENEDDGIPF